MWIVECYCSFFRLSTLVSSGANIVGYFSFGALSEHKDRSSGNIGGKIFCMKKQQQNARILRDICPKKTIKIPEFL